MSADVVIRPIEADESEAFRRALSVPFGEDVRPEHAERFEVIFERDRLRAAVDNGRFVGTLGAFSLQLQVPGAVVPTAGTTLVTVMPTHRRQGVLRRMMTEHLREVYEKGESLAALWASETAIYGRFGYGPASEFHEASLIKTEARLREPATIGGTMQLLDRDAALDAFPALFERAVAGRPGAFHRPPHWWTHRRLDDPESYRRGASEHRRVLHTRDGEPVGSVLYRTKYEDEERMEVIVVELIAVDADAERSLWQYLFGIDLVSKIRWWNLPMDSPLPWWLVEPRALKRQPSDGIWIRPVDVPKALAARRYSQPGTLVLRVRDDVCPWNDGLHRLEVDADGRGTCRALEGAAAEPDVTLTASTLGSTYLGGHRFTDLAQAGLVQGDEPNLDRADAMFAWSQRPWCPEVF